MNERLKELYKEATGKDWAYDFDPQVAEKFAESIIRECADIADNWVDDKDNGKNYPSEVLKKHFGVQ